MQGNDCGAACEPGKLTLGGAVLGFKRGEGGRERLGRFVALKDRRRRPADFAVKDRIAGAPIPAGARRFRRRVASARRDSS